MSHKDQGASIVETIVTITCDRVTAEDIVVELKKDQEGKIRVNSSERRLTGVETVQIVASLSTLGVNLLKAWLDARPHLQHSVRVEQAGKAKDGETSTGASERGDG
jgi:hypothetical protein